jgi:hypothetical protein
LIREDKKVLPPLGRRSGGLLPDDTAAVNALVPEKLLNFSPIR